MFILLKSGAMLNLFWLQDCFQGKHDKNIVIFYTTNGVKLIEEYDSEAEAEARVDDVHSAMARCLSGGSNITNVQSLSDGEHTVTNVEAKNVICKDGKSLEDKLKAQAEQIEDKVEKTDGYSLVADTEIQRLAQVNNYDDSEIKQSIIDLSTTLDWADYEEENK